MNGIRFVLPCYIFARVRSPGVSLPQLTFALYLVCFIVTWRRRCINVVPGRDIIYSILTSLCIEGFPFRLNYGVIFYYFFKPKGLTLENAMPYDCEMTDCKYHTMFLLMLNIHYFKISNIKVRIYWELNLTTGVVDIIHYAMETCEIFCYLLHHTITVAWLIYRKMV